MVCCEENHKQMTFRYVVFLTTRGDVKDRFKPSTYQIWLGWVDLLTNLDEERPYGGV